MGKRVAVVVGGSVAGLACAHAVAGAGWDVVVLEKAAAPAGGGGTGAGLGLDPQSMETLARWIPGWGLDAATLALAVDLVSLAVARARSASEARSIGSCDLSVYGLAAEQNNGQRDEGVADAG
jgi:2-polyprenyl-6-methoxyphenol hydroxylase-like FAD-dependent oxidoreductase